MERKKKFYVLEELGANKEKNEQETEITGSQKARRQEWIKQLRGERPLDAAIILVNAQTIELDKNGGKQQDKELSNLLSDQGEKSENKLGVIDEKSQHEKIPDSVIRMLVDKFLKDQILTTNSDLNSKQTNLDPTYGNLRWDIPDLVKHKITKQYNKMLHDKYGFCEEPRKSDKIYHWQYMWIYPLV